MSSAYGPIVTDDQIEDLLLGKLRGSIEQYLGEVERATGRPQGSISKPTSWGIPKERFDKWPSELTPHIGVVAGTAENPVPDGEGLYSVSYPIEVTVVVMASGPREVESLSKAYIAAVEAVLLQQPAGDPIEDVIWNGHSPENLGDKDRSMVAMTARFTVIARNVRQRRPGPLASEDPRDPPPAEPTVETVGIVGQRLPVA